jgi:O-antigen/teichoic acid export membrane protein
MEKQSFSSEETSLTTKALWLSFAKSLGLVFTFLLPLILVRQLSVRDFGLYRQVFLVVNTAVTFLPFGFALSGYYFFPRESGSRKQAVVLNIVLFYLLVGCLAGSVLFLRPGILSDVFNTSDLLHYERWIGLTLVFWVSTAFLEYVAIANEEARLAGGLVIVTNFARTVLLLGAAFFFGSVSALIGAAIVQGFLQAAIAVSYLASRFPEAWRRFDPRLLRAQLGYVLPLGVAGVLWWFQTDLHSYFVSSRFGPEAFAIYAVGCVQIPLWGVLLDSVGSVMIPAVSHLQDRKDYRGIVLLTARMMRKLVAFGFPLYFFLMVNGREFIQVLFTERYLESWPVFAISLTLIPLSVISSAYDPVFRAYPEHIRFLIRTRIALLAPLLLGLSYATERIGLIGAIAVVTGVNAVERLVIAGKVIRILGVTWRDLALLKDVAKLLLSAMAAALASELTRDFMRGTDPWAVLAVSAIVFGIVYLSLLFLSGVPERNEREALRQAVSTAQQYSGLGK